MSRCAVHLRERDDVFSADNLRQPLVVSRIRELEVARCEQVRREIVERPAAKRRPPGGICPVKRIRYGRKGHTTEACGLSPGACSSWISSASASTQPKFIASPNRSSGGATG